ncbi:HTH domain-containing protein [Halomarina litorea]|uniref:HTH domain-containing protein n=1 Tax=Halomarina litorea TaxID=2961595 RepID=UPI0020C5ADFF|nr:HTH domain-containing protein [Halomarina sp. BCD28]
MASRHPDITVTCYVRPSLLLEPVDSHIRTLREAEADGQIDALLLRSWSDQITLTRAGPASEGVEAFERFTEWAYAEGVSIQPPFDVRRRDSLITGECREVLVTPLCCLAVYVGSTLVGVYPHVDDGEPRSVTDAIAALRTGELREEAAALPATSTEDCPRCGGVLLNGQGVFGCSEADCEWVGLRDEEGAFVDMTPLRDDASPTDRESARRPRRTLTQRR